MPPSAAGLERLWAALAEAGYEASVRHDEFPSLVELRDERSGGEIQRFAVFVHDLDEPEEGSSWIRPEGRWPREAEDKIGSIRRRRLTLGYVPRIDVFAGWPSHDAGESRRKRLWVPRRALLEAEAEGWSEPRTSSIAYCFRPQEVRRYLRRHAEAEGELRTVLVEGIRRSFYASGSALRDFAVGPVRLPAPDAFEPLRPAAEEKPPAVETGFSSLDGPPRELLRALEPDQRCLFWFGVGAGMETSIESSPIPLPKDLPEGTRLTVQLFPFEDGLQLEGPTRGELEVLGDGRARVTGPAAEVPNDSGLGELVLFFGVRTLDRVGEQRLRCNLYLGSTVLQSRLVTCQVGVDGQAALPPIRSEVDYAIASVLDPERLDRIPCHDFSITVNGGGLQAQPTHELRFFGAEREFTGSASISGDKLGRAITATRGALRQASWETEEEWIEEKDDYCYAESSIPLARLEADLKRMALRGSQIYEEIVGALSAEMGGPIALEEAMREPGRVQMVTVDNGLYVPAALFYDQPFEDSPGAEDVDRYHLCEEFVNVLADEAPLEESRCMRGHCPSYEDEFAICPSGFWGFRHEIGWPIADPETLDRELPSNGTAQMVVGVSTALELQKDHVRTIRTIGSGELVKSREEFKKVAIPASPHLVYFYCHGGIGTGTGAPFIELGPRNSAGITRNFLRREKIRWEGDSPRPVVFINGCHTSALDPESIASLVEGFVQVSNAIGVIGTEVTIFEPLACAFGETVLKGFLAEKKTIGAAVRHARLELLKTRNPLGLVYVPFVASEIQLGA